MNTSIDLGELFSCEQTPAPQRIRSRRPFPLLPYRRRRALWALGLDTRDIHRDTARPLD